MKSDNSTKKNPPPQDDGKKDDQRGSGNGATGGQQDQKGSKDSHKSPMNEDNTNVPEDKTMPEDIHGKIAHDSM